MPARLNLRIYAGATFAQSLRWRTGEPAEPVDLTGATARMQIRASASDAAPLISLTTENGRIDIPDPESGEFTMRLSAAETSALQVSRAEYQFEIAMPDGTVRRLFEGWILVSPEITR